MSNNKEKIIQEKNKEISQNNSNFINQIQEKDVILQDIGTIRRYCNDKIADFSLMIKEINIKINNKLDLIEKSQKKLIDLYVDLKRKTEIISEFSDFKIKTKEDIYSNKIQIEGIQKDINDMTFKYDRIYIDNFNFPGLIGDENRFKNFKEYVFFQVETTDDLKSAKESNDNMVKQLERRFDENVSYLVKQIEKSEKLTKQYTDNKNKYLENFLNENLDKFYSKAEELKLENHKYAVKLLNRCDNLTELEIKLLEISNLMEEKVSQYEEKLKNFKLEKTEKLDFILEKYKSIENNINEMSEYFLKTKNIANFQDEMNEKVNKMNDEINKVKITHNQEILEIINENKIQYENIKSLYGNGINIKTFTKNENNEKVSNAELLNLKQNFQKKFYKIDERFEEMIKENRKERLILEEKLNKKILDLNDQVRHTLSSKEKSMNNILEKVNNLDKNLYEYRKNIKEINTKLSEFETLINDKKKVLEEIEELKKGNNTINTSIKKFDNNFNKIFQDYKELEYLVKEVLREKKRMNSKNQIFPFSNKKIEKEMTQVYASQTTREFFNRNNNRKQNNYNLNSFDKNLPFEEIKTSIKLKKNFSNPKLRFRQRSPMNKFNESSPRLQENNTSKLRDETFSSKQKRFKLLSIKEILQRLPDYISKDFVEEEERNQKKFEEVIKKETNKNEQ